MKTIRSLVALLFLLGSTGASASFVSQDLYTLNDNLLTHDTETDLEWLNLTLTTGMTYYEVIASDFVNTMGFRYASYDEVLTMYQNAGADPATASDLSSSNFLAANEVLTNLGCSSEILNPGTCGDAEAGFYHFGMWGDGQGIALVDVYLNYGKLDITWALNTPLDSLVHEAQSNYLVRDYFAVPLPAAFWLMISGGLCLFALGSRKK